MYTLCGGKLFSKLLGCIVAKELQKIQNKQLKKLDLPKQPQRTAQKPSHLKPVKDKDCKQQRSN